MKWIQVCSQERAKAHLFSTYTSIKSVLFLISFSPVFVETHHLEASHHIEWGLLGHFSSSCMRWLNFLDPGAEYTFVPIRLFRGLYVQPIIKGFQDFFLDHD